MHTKSEEDSGPPGALGPIYKHWARYASVAAPYARFSSRAQFWACAARHAKYNAQNLAAHAHLNIRQIERRCREELGRTPQEWLNEQKLVAARWLLLENESIKEVAMDLGFKQLSHFCREFKQAYGITPSQFLHLQRRLAQNVANR